MSDTPKFESKLRRYGPPMKRVKLTFEPVVPLDGPVTTGPLRLARRPLVRVKLTFEPVNPVHIELAVNLRPDTDADATARLYDRMTAIVDLIAKIEPDDVGGELRLDVARSGVGPGPTVGLVLTPVAAGEADRLRNVARLLTTAVGDTPGRVSVVARVISAADPTHPLYEVAG